MAKETKNIAKGDKIKVNYTGTFDDGTVFDSSEGREPLEFSAGAGMVIKGFDDAVIGMKKNEEKTIKIKPSEAYGDHNPQLLKEIPRNKLPQGQEIKAGMVVGLGTPDGRQFPARITEVTADHVTIDLNHPLAGKTLNFKIKIVEC